MLDGDEDFQLRLQACLDRLVAGDPAGKVDLIEIAYTRLENLAHRMLERFRPVRRSNDTGDIVQEACLRLMRSIDAVQPGEPRRFLGLAGLEIRRVLLDLYRKCRGPESYEANHATNVVRDVDGGLRHHVDELPDAGHGGDDSGWERLHEAVDKLDPEDQELFHMRWFLGMNHAQIATHLGCSERTVKRSWNRVKESLRRTAEGASDG